MRKLEALYDDIVAAGAPEPVILPLDLAKASADDFGNVATALQAQLGRVDGLVHTAALLGSLGPIEHQSFDSWLALLRVNVAAPMGLTRALMPLLSASADASVVFTLDNRGEQPRAYWGGYAVTKAGVAALARELADEWENRPHLRINAVVPGPDPLAAAGPDASGRGPRRAAAARSAGAAVPAPAGGSTRSRTAASSTTLSAGSRAPPRPRRCARSAASRAGAGTRRRTPCRAG